MAILKVNAPYRNEDESRSDLSLPEAIRIVNGDVALDTLSDQMKEQIAGSLHEPNQIIVDLAPNSVIELDQEYAIRSEWPVTIRGNGVTIQGPEDHNGIRVCSSGVCIESVHFDGFFQAVRIDAEGGQIHNIKINGCTFTDISMSGIAMGSSESHGVTEDVTVYDCLFKGWNELEKTSLQRASLCMLVQAAMAAGKRTVSGCYLKNMVIDNCRFIENTRIGVQICVAYQEPTYGDIFADTSTSFEDCHIEGLTIQNSYIKGAWDATINHFGASRYAKDCSTSGLVIRNNTLFFRAWGIYIAGGEPGFIGKNERCGIKGCTVEGNKLEFYEGVGRPTCGICVNGGRIDYESAEIEYCYIRDITIRGNEIKNSERGVMLIGGHGMIDAEPPGLLRGCSIVGAAVAENALTDVDRPFIVHGTFLEGRRTVVRYGMPPQTKAYLPLRTDHGPRSLLAEANYVDNVRIEGNRVSGSRYYLLAVGSYASGHAQSSGNYVGGDFTFSDNRFDDGEGHLLVGDQWHEDWAQGESNEAKIDRTIIGREVSR